MIRLTQFGQKWRSKRGKLEKRMRRSERLSSTSFQYDSSSSIREYNACLPQAGNRAQSLLSPLQFLHLVTPLPTSSEVNSLILPNLFAFVHCGPIAHNGSPQHCRGRCQYCRRGCCSLPSPAHNPRSRGPGTPIDYL